MAEEFFEVLDENGEKTGQVKARSAVHHDGDWHAAINVFIVNEKNEVLQQRRAADKDSYPNMWDLSCGGHVTVGEDSITATLRELKEELGLDTKPEDLIRLGRFKTSARPTEDFINNSFEEVHLLRTTKKLTDFRLQKSELSAIRYMPWRQLREMVQDPKPADMLRHRTQYGALFEYLEKEENKK